MLQRLQQYRAEHPGAAEADWLGPLFVGAGSAEVSAGGSRVLCVGCGDGSYEMGLALAGARGLTVSFYDSEAKAKQRYSNFVVNANVLRALGVPLLFEVDVTRLGPSLAAAAAVAGTAVPAEFSRIVFNFPQTGSGFPGSEAWHAAHAALLRGFFAGTVAGDLCGQVAEVWVTLMDRAPYSELALDDWAAEHGLAKQRALPFGGGFYGLYRHRMTRFDRVVKADAASSCHVYARPAEAARAGAAEAAGASAAAASAVCGAGGSR